MLLQNNIIKMDNPKIFDLKYRNAKIWRILLVMLKWLKYKKKYKTFSIIENFFNCKKMSWLLLIFNHGGQRKKINSTLIK